MMKFGRPKAGMSKKPAIMSQFVPGMPGAPAMPGSVPFPGVPATPSATFDLSTLFGGAKNGAGEAATPGADANQAGGPISETPNGPAPYKPSAWAVLDRVLGGDTITEARRRLVNEHSADQASQSQMATLQSALAGITDPRERIAFLLNPTEYGKSLSSRYGAQNVTGGNTVVYGEGGPTYTAPKVEMSGDSGVVLTPDGMTVMGQRPISQAEKTELDKVRETARRNDIMEKLGMARVGVAEGQLGVSRGRLGLAREKQAAGGTGGGSSPALDAIAAELKRRGKLK